jgi:geranylgeranyl pyrophosphate synthase
MDDAYWRRGELCAHLRHGQGTATLAALALITRAYALTGAAIARAPAKRQLKAHLLIDRCLGAAGMLNGQARDLHFQPEAAGARAPIVIAMAKTVPLIQLALVLPAILGSVDETERRMLRRLSVCWGLFYQGVDDLKDIAEVARPNIARELGPEAVARYLDRLARSASNRVNALVAASPRFAFLASYHQLLLRRREQLPRVLP